MLLMAEREHLGDDDTRKQRQRQYQKEWRAKNRDIYRSFGKAHYEADRDKILARQYGLSPEAVRALRRANGGRCAICGVVEERALRAVLQIDHDHATGIVRDLLCGKCNTGIGMFHESAQALMAAAEYLDTHRTHPRTEEALRVLVAAHPDPVAPSAPAPEPWREMRNIRNIAEMCGVSQRTVRNWVRDNRVEWCRTPTGQLRIYLDTVLHRKER